MLPEQLTIQDDFPPVTYEQWREVVERDLKGAPFEKKLVAHTYEGFDLQPIYTRADRPTDDDPHGVPGMAPFVRGGRLLGAAQSGWDLRQQHAHPDLAVANRNILADLEGGATSVELRLDAAARAGIDPDDARATGLAAVDGLSAYSLSDLDVALAGVDLNLAGVGLQPGAAFAPAAAALFALLKKRQVPGETAQVAVNADPIGALATEGTLPYTLEDGLRQLADLAAWTAEHYPNSTPIGIDTSPYHNAGATAAQDIAFAAATGIEYLRAATAVSIDVDTAARGMLFGMSIGTHHFLAIAKLRAARRVWSRVVEASGGSAAAGAMRIHARTSSRVLTRRDPYVNLLRNTVAAFAASLGGADVITSVPFDHLEGLPDEQSRRVARNTLLVLQEEAHLNRVIDPAGGSWFLDSLTDDLAEAAWATMQEVERQGGMIAALQAGWVAQQIDSAYAPRAKDIARRKQGITGVSEFPDILEGRVPVEPVDSSALHAAAAARVVAARTVAGVEVPDTDAAVNAAASGATVGQIAKAFGFHKAKEESTALKARSFAEPFERLRDATDAWLAQHGCRPRVFLANLGPVAHHTARATYSKNFFEAGGFEVITNDGFADADAAAAALKQSDARVAVLCSSDKLYPGLVPDAAPKLKAAGARTVVLAGFPGDNEAAWRAAGVDRFIYVKCNVLDTLQDMLREEGVLAS